jgi:diadenosine tetraphosphate (Ap4A) HIT family hydrolase
VGPSAGQTIFHLHWHVLGSRNGQESNLPSMTAVTEL